MTHLVERVEARYDVIEVEFGMVYKWCPASMVVVCDCGERASLINNVAVCPGCREDYEDILREETEAGRLREEAKHSWREAMEREVAVPGWVYWAE